MDDGSHTIPNHINSDTDILRVYATPLAGRS